MTDESSESPTDPITEQTVLLYRLKAATIELEAAYVRRRTALQEHENAEKMRYILDSSICLQPAILN